MLRTSQTASFLALAISLSALGWAWKLTRTPLPALSERPVQGALLDSPAGARFGVDPGAERVLEIPATGTVQIELSDLAFDDYDPPELRGQGAGVLGPEAFPETVARLHGREVELRGFPLVTGYGDGGARRLLLTRFPPGCCFGNVPVLDEWVAVEVREGAQVDPGTGYDPLLMRGTFLAGERMDESGFVESLYRLEEARPAE